MASGLGGGGGPGHNHQDNEPPQHTSFTVNLDNLPFQVGSNNPQGGTNATSQGNLGRVMQDIWPQIEQRIAQQALSALRDRHPHGGTGPAGHNHGHGVQHPGVAPMLNPGANPPQLQQQQQQTQAPHLVINIGRGAGAHNTEPDVNQNTDDHHGNQGGPPQAPPAGQQQQQQMPTVRGLLKSMEGSLPFIFLMLAKVLYNHRLGILVFVGLFGTFFHANSSLRRLVAQRESRNWADSLGGLAWIVALLGANIFFIYYVFEEQKLYRSLYMGLPDVEGTFDLWTLMWITGVNDFVVKFGTILVKAVVALLPKQILQAKKKGKYFMLIETVSQFYRSILPIMPWVIFLQNDEHGGQWFSIVLLILYLVAKGNHMLYKCKELRRAISRFQVDVSYGSVPSHEQLQSADNSCPICQDKFTDPVLLSCRHIFCEDCVSMWFDRERTCPMCRANIVDNPQWRDGATSANLQTY